MNMLFDRKPFVNMFLFDLDLDSVVCYLSIGHNCFGPKPDI